MLALRGGETVNLMIEQARIAGPDIGRRNAGEALSPCIQLGSFVHDDDEELLAWYTQWRLPSMTTLPGCVGVRKPVNSRDRDRPTLSAACTPSVSQSTQSSEDCAGCGRRCWW